MAEFTLPANSKIGTGKVVPAPPGAARVRQFKIYRWNPDDGKNPVTDKLFAPDLDQCGPMVLDALIKIKNEIEHDTDLSPLLPRRGVRLVRDEYRRVSNTLACIQARSRTSRGPVRIYPLPHMPVIKDLVSGPDAHRRSVPIDPARGCRPRVPRRRIVNNLQSEEEREQLDGLVGIHLCFCCSTASQLLWNGERYLGPAVLLQAYRWIADSRAGRRRAARRARRPVFGCTAATRS